MLRKIIEALLIGMNLSPNHINRGGYYYDYDFHRKNNTRR